MATVTQPITAARASGKDTRLVIATAGAGTVSSLGAFLVPWWGLPSGPPHDFANAS